MFEVTYSGINLTEYIKVTKVNKSILPNKNITLTSIPNRHGAYYNRSTYEPRIIEIDYIFKGNNSEEYNKLIRDLASNLDANEPSELWFSDEPNLVYYAILQGDTGIDNIKNIGSGKLTFICPDIYAYSIDEKEVIMENNTFTYNNEGTASVYPVMEFKFSQDASYLNITSPNGEKIIIGSPASVDKKAKKKSNKVHEDMTSTQNWTNAGNVLDGSSVNNGTIASDGNSIYCNNYGEAIADTWHGAGYRLNMTNELKDFKVETRINFTSADGTSKPDGNQKGKLEIYLFDINGSKIGKMSMRDSYKNFEFNIPEIYVGNKTFLEVQPDAPDGKKVSQKNYKHYVTKKNDKLLTIAKKFKISLATLRKLNGLSSTTTEVPKGTRLLVGSKEAITTVYPEKVGVYNDFFGTLTLQRKNKTWYAEVARLDDNKRKYKITKKVFVDSGSKKPTGDLAYIVIAFLQYGNQPVVRKMKVTDLLITKYDSVNTETENDMIFEKDDLVTVDCNTSSVYRNEELIMEEVNINTDFFSIPVGLSEVTVQSDDNALEATSSFNEKLI